MAHTPIYKTTSTYAKRRPSRWRLAIVSLLLGLLTCVFSGLTLGGTNTTVTVNTKTVPITSPQQLQVSQLANALAVRTTLNSNAVVSAKLSQKQAQALGSTGN